MMLKYHHFDMGTDLLSATRRNHALEHATISIILSRMPSGVRLLGQSGPSGFYIWGDLPTETVTAAAHEALQRLQRGEAHLAVSPFCGTNLVTAAVLATIAVAIALGGKNRLQRLPNAIMAALWALFLAQPIGGLLQKYLTTSPELSNARIVSIARGGFGPWRSHRVAVVHG